MHPSNPLVRLAEFGQSPWLDAIDRELLASGALARLIGEDGVKGVTSNPAIFEKAIAGGGYAAAIAAAPAGLDPVAVYETLALGDIRAAADALAGVYAGSGRADGYVSLEVAPALAHDTTGTVEEARRLWAAIARPNAMIKVPGTPAGTAAIATLIEDGINVNVTLLFSLAAYRAAAEAFVAGLEARAARGLGVDGVASVASFFVSRIDSAVDAQLPPGHALRGKVAIANAQLAYRHYASLVGSARWQALARRGALPQRLLWASTGTKNPAYSDVLYVDELVGRDTVNTLPVATLEAFRDHGRPRAALEEQADPERVMRDLSAAGITLDAVTARLLEEGLAAFAKSFASLIGMVARQAGRA